MRIHTNLTEADIRRIVEETNAPGVGVGSLSVHGSRKRDRGIELQITGHSLQGGAFGAVDFRTALWDEWGLVLTRIFEADPDAIAGPYNGRDDFQQQTQFRFDELTPDQIHRRHRWEYVSGYYFQCECGAERRTHRP